VWIGAHFGIHRNCVVGVLGPGLHDGLLGVAMFLAQYADVTGDAEARHLAMDATRTAVSQISRGALGQVLGLTGLGGAVYALSHLGALWADERLLREATTVARQLPALITVDRQHEVMGGTAGALFGLLSRHRAAADGQILDLIRQAADHLVAVQRPYGSGASWLPAELAEAGIADRPLAGFAHGTAGIAAALLAAAGRAGDGTWAKAAHRGFDYERDLFDTMGGHWRDVRDPDVAGQVDITYDDGSARRGRPVAWCHGSPGVGLARLGADRPDELATAVADTLQEGFGNGHSLCHGDMGSLDFLQLAATRTGQPALHARVRRHAATILETADRAGWHCGLHRDIEMPGLLTGLAGIGYGLLRTLVPELPSVLAQEPPLLRG
jgi:lantibiotic modifying enzyme